MGHDLTLLHGDLRSPFGRAKMVEAMHRGVSSTEVDGEPNGRFVRCGPGYPMGSLRRDQHVVSRTKVTFALSLDP